MFTEERMKLSNNKTSLRVHVFVPVKLQLIVFFNYFQYLRIKSHVHENSCHDALYMYLIDVVNRKKNVFGTGLSTFRNNLKHFYIFAR